MLFSFATSLLIASLALVKAEDHKIVVGGSAGLVFTPESITAAVGDTVTFEFQTKNHTVTQSAFATPCNLLTNTTTNAVGFNSGFVPVAANATAFPAWTLEVTVATPIWFFCAQANHCASGMVGAINAATTGAKTFAAFKALAMGQNSTGTTTGGTAATSANGDGIGATGGSVTGGTSGAAQTNTPTSDNSSAGSLKVGVAGSILSIAAAVLLL
jgi:plastocyanin